ncbi:MAG: phosphopantetheine-binding protein [Acidobacteriota bacterium]
MSDQVREFVIKAIEKKSRLPAGCNVDTFNYIDSGHVDSIAIIKFILELEEEFKIDIAPEEVESAEFRTIGGLVGIIKSRIGA